MAFPPNNDKEWIRALRKLGFTENRVGRGKHAHKFTHPKRKTKDYRVQPNFIIIPHRIYPNLSAGIVKELHFFGFSLKEIKSACQ